MAAPQTPEDKLAQEYEEKFKACASARQIYEKQWYTNLAFYYGRQWAAWTPASRDGNQVTSLIDPPAPRWRVRLIANKIKPYVRNEFTKLTKEEPQFFVVPNTTDESDVAAARAANNVAEYLLDAKYYNRIRRQSTFWACITGNGFQKVYFDPSEKDDDGIPGKICFESPSPWHIFVPWLQVEEVQRQPYVIHAMAVDPDYISKTYGKDVEPDTEVTGAQLDQRFKAALGIKNDKDKSIKQCYVKEYWVKPCKNFPDGAMFVTASGKIVYMYEGLKEVEVPGDVPVVGQVVSDYPYEHGWFPFTKIDHIPTGRFYAQAAIDDLIPLQREYNRTRSQILEAKNRTSKPQYSIVKGSVDPAKMTSEPGLIVEVMPGFERPQPLSNPEVPNYVIQELDRTTRDMDEIAGQYEVAKGRTPPGVEAASAIAYLQEENDTRLYHTVASIEEAVQEVGKQTLALVHQFWDEPRIVRVISTNNMYETMQFKGADLKGNLDFRVESGSMAPRSRAAKQAFITELMKMGTIPPALGLKYLQMSETSRLYQELQLDERQAQRENFRMRDGVFLQTNEWDNHEAHILEHGNFMKTQEFELMPEEIRAAFLAHYKQHQVMTQMEMMEQVGEEDGPGQSTESEPV